MVIIRIRVKKNLNYFIGTKEQFEHQEKKGVFLGKSGYLKEGNDLVVDTDILNKSHMIEILESK